MRAKLLIVLLWVAMATEAIAASARSQNFAVNAQSQEMAQRIARDAEGHRQRIALALLGRELPTWRAPCAVTVSEGGSSSGVTSFNFANAADSIDMTVRGPRGSKSCGTRFPMKSGIASCCRYSGDRCHGGLTKAFASAKSRRRTERIRLDTSTNRGRTDTPTRCARW